MDQFSERALPATLMATKPKVIAAGIVQEQLVVEKSNTIPTPTPAGTEIQFYISQLANTFWDCSSAYLLLTCVLQFANLNVGTIYGNDCNGAILGSFYSIIQRMTVFAGTVNVTDDIQEVGLIAAYYLRLTMTKQARQGMAFLMGFTTDPECTGCLAQYRIKGTFPMTADGDAQIGHVVVQLGAGPPVVNGTMYGSPLAQNDYQNQCFQVALPLIGSLGLNNPGMYYLGLGQTKVSFYTDTPNNFCLFPTTNVAAQAQLGLIHCVPTQQAAGVACNTNSVQYCAGLTLSGFSITRARLIANIIRLDDSVMQKVIALMQPVNGAQLVTKCASFAVTTQPLALGSNGLQMIQMNIRRGSVKSILVTFNPQGTSNLAINGELANYFKKYGSINPGLGANTMLTIENVNYPKLGLNPTQFPGETYAYIMENLGLLDNDNIKPSIEMANWLVADPNVPTTYGAGFPDPTAPAVNGNYSIGIGGNWRSGAILTTAPTIAAGGINGSWWLQTFMSPESILLDGANTNSNPSQSGRQATVDSNDFFLYFNLEDQPRPGMISGKNTQNGANTLNLNLSVSTTYTYNIYMIALFDALLVQDFASNNVYYVT